MSDEQRCFVIAPIGEPDSDTRKRSDQVLKHVIRPAVATCGYKAIRADEIDKPGIITSQVIQHVVNDPLVVADLTERNPNVFYELAIRHALRKPLVQIIKKGERIPFDVASTRTIQVDHKDLDSVDTAKSEIIDQVKSLEKDSSDLETPISVSLDLQLLRQSEKPEKRSLADLVAAVADLRGGLGKIETKIGTSDEEGALDEIQSSIRRLARRIDERFEGAPFLLRRSRRFHPMMLSEMTGIGPHSSPAVGVVVLASLFREIAPWIYEVGLEAYRELRRGVTPTAQQCLDEFRSMIEYMMHSRMGHELFGRSKEFFIIMEEVEPMLDRTMKMIAEESPRIRGRNISRKATEEDARDA